MRMLTEKSFQKASQSIRDSARLLEKRIFEHYFYGAGREEVLMELKKYQNHDGGFGNGFEPDFRLPASSPMATSIAFQLLIQHDDSNMAADIIKEGVRYFESTFIPERCGWFSVPKEVNHFAHAPWWHYDEKAGMTCIDEYWGNPSAEMIAYLCRYKDLVQTLNVDDLLNYAIHHLNSLDQFKSSHEIYCYIRLYELLDDRVSSKIKDKLTLAVQSLVCDKREKWDQYVPLPLKFIRSPYSCKFGMSDELIEDNLDYLVESIESNGKIEPCWEWGNDESEWEKARKEWIGILTLEALITLDKFGRIQR